jgi:hypothetical protein
VQHTPLPFPYRLAPHAAERPPKHLGAASLLNETPPSGGGYLGSRGQFRPCGGSPAPSPLCGIDFKISCIDQSKSWFGYEVAKVIGVDDVGPKTPGRAKVIKIIKKWLETGVIHEIDGTDKQRKPRKFIAPGTYRDEQPETTKMTIPDLRDLGFPGDAGWSTGGALGAFAPPAPLAPPPL